MFPSVRDPIRRALVDLLLEREPSVGDLECGFASRSRQFRSTWGLGKQAGCERVRRRRRWYQLNAEPMPDVHEWAAT